ncbi:MAG: hypothetical protein RIS29_1835 [Bacteroidota bacterium]|jgi:cob(I)alamin adenosyltransferase
MKVYTKTGDKGTTGLIGGTRVDKNDIRLEAYGTIDELNSHIGVLSTYEMADDNLNFLRFVQNKLFSIGSHLATDRNKVNLHTASIIDQQTILLIESEIDRLDSGLPELNYFILPGGSRAGAYAHVCRTVARRAERCTYDVILQKYEIENEVLVFLNRLSDYFFVLSRYLTFISGGQEIYWKTLEK